MIGNSTPLPEKAKLGGIPTPTASPTDGQVQAYDSATASMEWANMGGGGSVAWADVTGKPTEFPPSAHTHIIANVTGLQAALDGKQAAGSYAAAVHTHTLAAITDAGTAASRNVPTTGDADSTQVVLGSDTRLTNARTPTAHTHPISDITGLQTALDGKQATLVSATNIRTVNGNSLLGSGNLAITAPASLTTAQAFCTAETTLTAATYADITGASISLTAGTWLIFATINASSQTTTATVIIAAITDSANTVIVEGAQHIVAGTATVRTWGNVTLTAIVTPATTTTYKLRGARGTTTQTGNCIVSDGTGLNTANNVSNNSDRSTSIRAVRIVEPVA